MADIFEYLAHFEQEDRANSRKAVALARVRANKRFAKFIDASVNEEDKKARLTLVAGDLRETVKQACAECDHENWEPVLDTIASHLGMVVEARRPKMCPVHREVVDISLGSGDPQAGFAAMANQLFSEHSCRGGFEGRCNFKPEMVAQSFWDKRQEEADTRRQDRLDIMEQNTVDITEPMINETDEAANDTADLAPAFDDSQVSDLDYNTDDFGSELEIQAEPAMSMAALKVRTAAHVDRALVHNGSLSPLEMIESKKPGLAINGLPFEQFKQSAMGQPMDAFGALEVSHPHPTWEGIAADILRVGHEGPLRQYFDEKRRQKGEGGAPVPIQPPGPDLGPQNGPAYASIHEAEALKTIKVEDGDGPLPKMDKRKWTPENVKAESPEMDGTPHPTKHQDILQPANYEKDFEDDIDAVLEHQDVTKSQNPTDGGGPATSVFPKGNTADPVTLKLATIDPTSDENPDNFALCQHGNPKESCEKCKQRHEAFISEDEIRQALAAHKESYSGGYGSPGHDAEFGNASPFDEPNDSYGKQHAHPPQAVPCENCHGPVTPDDEVCPHCGHLNHLYGEVDRDYRNTPDPNQQEAQSRGLTAL